MKTNLMLIVSVALTAPTAALADNVGADEVVHCDAGQVRVCTKPEDGGFRIMFDDRGRPLYTCSVSTDVGVDLRCVPEDDVCTATEVACDSLGGNWRWSERRCRCYQHVEPARERDGGSGGSGGGNTNVSVTVAACDAQDFANLKEEMDQIERDLQVVAELHPLQLRATAVYSRLLECDDGSAEATSLINRAAELIAKFEPEAAPAPHDYTADLERIRAEIANANDRPVVVNVEPEENWCTDTHTGRFVCIALPIILGIGAAVAIPVLYDYFDDGSYDSRTRYEY